MPQAPLRRAYVGVGSNLGDRMGHIHAAIDAMAQRLHTQLQLSPWFETAPVGGPAQPHYLNGAIAFETNLPPTTLLAELLAIESELGRIRHERWGPRCIDLDLLLLGDLTLHVETPLALILPHPRLHLRRFVLKPLAALAPETIHPIFGQSIWELLEACPDYSHVVPYEP